MVCNIRAEVGVVAVSSASSYVVRLQRVEGDVGVAADRGIQILEDLLVARWGLGILCLLVELRVRLESLNGVRGNLWAVAVRLDSARVLRVDEATVRAILRGLDATISTRMSFYMTTDLPLGMKCWKTS